MGQRGADIIDELLFNQLFAVPDAVEDFTHCDGCDGMLANETEAFLVFRRRRVFHPEHAIIFNAFTKVRRFNRR